MFFAADADGAEIDAARAAARGAGIRIGLLAPGVLEKVADAVAPQGCVTIAPDCRPTLGDLSLTGGLLVLDEVRDPGNLGAVVRVAEAAGFEAIVLTGAAVDPYGPKALRGSTGSTFRLPVVEVGPILPLLETLTERGVVTMATSSHEGDDFAVIEWPERVAIVLGNEAAGLDQAVVTACARRITIPIAESVESLNLAVSAGILAFAVSRRLTARGASAQVLR